MAKLRVDKIASVGASTETTGSVFFDGNADHLKLPNSTDFNYGSGDFSIEAWVYLLSSAGGSDNHGIASNYITSGNKRSWLLYLAGATPTFIASSDGTSGENITVSSSVDVADETWTHIAVSKTGADLTIYVNGVQRAKNVSFHSSIYSNTDDPAEIGSYNDGSNTFEGYISNLRICKGHVVYTSNFAPPTRELEVHPGPDDNRTVLLACYDGENIFADKTGRHIISAYGDRSSTPTPARTDSPIGITTENPGLIRDVDNTFGPTFQGGVGYNSQNWLTLPKGTTTDRNRTGGRGITGGGNDPANTNLISYFTISSMGNAFDFGDLSGARTGVGACSSSTRGVFAGGGGSPAPAFFNTIEYVTIATTGDTQDFGDLDDERRNITGVSNQTRGVWAGGSRPASDNVMQYITFGTLGNAVDFGDTTDARAFGMAGASSPTRGLFVGGSPGSNIIDYITIASTGDAIDFGDLITGVFNGAGTSSNTRGIFAGGYNPTLQDNIEYVTISTLGNGQDFGNLIATNQGIRGTSNKIRGVFSGGDTPTITNTLQYITISSTGNAKDFGDLTSTIESQGSCSDSHGGLS